MGIGLRGTRPALLACAVLLSLGAGAAQSKTTAPSPRQHGPAEGHLPPVQQALDVVSTFEPTGAFGGILPEQIADLAVHKGFAYLNSWDNADCERGGTYVVDIRNPAAPQEVTFIPAQQPFYHGEGAHVISMQTPQFTGDVLAVNDETFGSNLLAGPCAPADKTGGGFDLYDVTNPANPVPLVQGAGDRSPPSSLVQDPDQEFANSYHSVFVWQDGPRAFLVASDNIEFSDVDIFDITDPRNPEFIADLDLFDLPQYDQIVGDGLLGNLPFVLHHDVVVKRVGTQMRMIVSYWDGGYVQLDVTNPATPTYITDTAFAGPDPLTGLATQEGNAHQSEFSHDNQFILAADEDFSAFLVDTKIGGDEIPRFSFGEPTTPDREPILELLIRPGDPLAGATRFIGDGCVPAAIPAPPAAPAIAVSERGVCGFQVKAENAEDAGYDGFVIFNNVAPADGLRCEVVVNMSFTPPFDVTIKGVFVPRRMGLQILGQDLTGYTCEEGDPGASTPAPAVGTDGPSLEMAATFDGWGYAHLYDANTSEGLDAFAIPEALDERFADGFGILSIHEFATDPTENLAYSSYYGGGVRVLSFDRTSGLVQRGAYIDPEGSNFWGIEQFTTPTGERLIAGSDRDLGLQIFRYTGPGAPKPPSCDGVALETAFETAVRVPLVCTDPNGNPLTRRIASKPAHGTVGDVEGDSVLYTPAAGFRGGDEFTFVANDGAADSPAATASVDVGRKPSNFFTMRLGKLRNGRLIVVVKVGGPGTVAAGLRANLPRAQATIARSVRLARGTRAATGAGKVRVVLRLSQAKRRALRRALLRKARIRGTVRVSFTPTGGDRRRARRGLPIRR